LTARQTALLDGAAARLRPGGALVYSTCSIEPEENGDTVRRWLAAHPQFTLAAEEWLLPGAHSTDGAYAALLHFRRP
jgi:16S rRNA (cytosine967-C5)-methyltransferase